MPLVRRGFLSRRLSKWISLAFAAAFFAIVSPAHALKTTLELKDDCALVEEFVTNPGVDRLTAARAAMCLGYITGYLEAMLAMQALVSAKPIYCPSDPMTTFRQWAAMYVKWAAAHPESWNLPASKTFTDIVRDLSACKRP
jgi:hypothetical protein